MKDSQWWHPLVVGIPLAAFAVVRWISKNFVSQGTFLDELKFYGGLAIAFVVVLIVLIIAIRRNVADITRNQKPYATVIDGNRVHVTGNVEKLQRDGVPGAISWTHIGFKEWVVTIQTNQSGTVEAEDAADLINRQFN